MTGRLGLGPRLAATAALIALIAVGLLMTIGQQRLDSHLDRLTHAGLAERPGLVDDRVAARSSIARAAEQRGLHRELDHIAELTAAAAIALALLGTLLVTRTLLRPLRQLTDMAERLGRGDLAVRAGRGGGAEIERLGRAFDALACALGAEAEQRRGAAAEVAHELRAPVAGIVARTEAAQDDVLPDARANLRALHAEALRLDALIDDVGRLADAGEPALELRRAALDLGAVAARRVRAHAGRYAAAGVSLRQSMQPVPVDGDERRLEQIVDNLLSNALRYTEPGGEVAVVVRRTREGATLEVRDTGIGMSPAEAERAFERYWRGARARSRASGGAGIGLAVVRELVHAHGGRVEIATAEGTGTTLRVALPAPDVAPPVSLRCAGAVGVNPAGIASAAG